MALLNSRVVDKIDSIFIENFNITSQLEEKNRKINVRSSILDADLEGEYNVRDITSYINNFVVRYIPSQIDDKNEIADLSNDVDFNITFHNTEVV